MIWEMFKIILILIPILLMKSEANVGKAEEIYNTDKSNNRNEKITYELMNSKYYFSAAIFAKEHIIEANEISPKFDDALETLVLKTGTMTFIGLHENVLVRHRSTVLNFLAGIKAFYAKKYEKSISYLKEFPSDHRFTPEAKFILASSYNLTNDDNKAIDEYNSCMKSSEIFEKQSKNDKLKRYFAILRESCIIHKARIEFKNRNYQAALKSYEDIPKSSYRWPYILLEKAWTSYYLNDYNRTLGILVTYKSPLLSSYFMPEAEVLTALSYFRLCLWQDSMQLVNQYYNVYNPRSKALKELLIPHKNSHTYFLKMMMSPISEQEHLNPYIRNLMTQIRKKVKFSLDLVNYKKAQNELKYLKKRKKQTDFIKKLTSGVTGAIGWRTKHLNHYIKKQMFSFINDIHRFSYEMFNIKLEIMSLERDLVYSNKKLISDRSRGSLENVNRRTDQHFFLYNGEFWADELGEYSFGLKSNCKKVKSVITGDKEKEYKGGQS